MVQGLCELLVGFHPLLACLFDVCTAEHALHVQKEFAEFLLLGSGFRETMFLSKIHQLVPPVKEEEHANYARIVVF